MDEHLICDKEKWIVEDLLQITSIILQEYVKRKVLVQFSFEKCGHELLISIVFTHEIIIFT